MYYALILVSLPKKVAHIHIFWSYLYLNFEEKFHRKDFKVVANWIYFAISDLMLWGKQKREPDIDESKHLGEGVVPATDSQPGIRLHRHRHVADKLLCLATPRPLRLDGGQPSPQHKPGNRCWGEKSRCVGEKTNTFNNFILSCHAEEGSTSRHPCHSWR